VFLQVTKMKSKKLFITILIASILCSTLAPDNVAAQTPSPSPSSQSSLTQSVMNPLGDLWKNVTGTWNNVTKFMGEAFKDPRAAVVAIMKGEFGNSQAMITGAGQVSPDCLNDWLGKNPGKNVYDAMKACTAANVAANTNTTNQAGIKEAAIVTGQNAIKDNAKAAENSQGDVKDKVKKADDATNKLTSVDSTQDAIKAFGEANDANTKAMQKQLDLIGSTANTSLVISGSQLTLQEQQRQLLEGIKGELAQSNQGRIGQSAANTDLHGKPSSPAGIGSMTAGSGTTGK
jgi:hypothetical protein